MTFERENNFISSLTNKKFKYFEIVNKILEHDINEKFYDNELTNEDEAAIYKTLKENKKNIGLVIGDNRELLINVNKANKNNLKFKVFITIKPNMYEKFLPVLFNGITKLDLGSIISFKKIYDNLSLVINLNNFTDVLIISEVIEKLKLNEYLTEPVLFGNKIGSISYLETTIDEYKYFNSLSCLISLYLEDSEKKLKKDLSFEDFYIFINEAKRKGEIGIFTHEVFDTVLGVLSPIKESDEQKVLIKKFGKN